MSLLDKIKTQIQNLIGIANEKTGNADTDLTSAVNTLVSGYGGEESEFGESYWIENLNGRTDLSKLFWYWKSEKPPYFDTSNATNWQQTFYYANVKEIPQYDFSKAENFYCTFAGCRYLGNLSINVQNATRIDMAFAGSEIKNIYIQNTNKITTFSGFCSNCGIESIKTLDLSSATNITNLFQNAKKLKEVLFVQGTIKISISFAQSNLLSTESIQSISDGLADLTGQTAQTITFHKDIEAKLTEEQKAQMTSKNWTIAFST